MYITSSEKESTQTRHDPGRKWINKVILSEKEIDILVVSQAEDDSAWSKPVRVWRSKPVIVSHNKKGA
jgi:hypothetical protein